MVRSSQPSAQQDVRRSRLAVLLTRPNLLRGLALLGCLGAAPVLASPFGFSVDVNFSPSQIPIRDPAGAYDSRVWNTLKTPQNQNPQSLLVDAYGKPTQTAATIEYQSTGFGRSEGLKVPEGGDRQLMSSYLASPAKITLNNLTSFLPVRNEPVQGRVVLYTYAGQPGALGIYSLGNERQKHIDTGLFNGQYTTGFDGNTVVFKTTLSGEMVIETEGSAPINGLSMILCRPGDLNGDGNMDAEDLAILTSAIKNGPAKNQYDVNFDLAVNFNDVLSWIKCSKGTCIGDANLDGVFDSGDLVQLFQSGLYESNQDATWMQGDWNGDCRFDSSDLLVAFQEGCYEAASPPARPTRTLTTVDLLARTMVEAEAVPEPSGLTLAAAGLALLGLRRHRPTASELA